MIEKFDRKPYIQKEADILDAILKDLLYEWDIIVDSYKTASTTTDPKAGSRGAYKVRRNMPKPKLWIPFLNTHITDIIISEPAVVVRFADKTKTVAKATGDDKFNAETGLYVCLLKKVMGNKEFWKTAEKCWEAMF